MKVGQNGDKKKVLEELLELGMVLVAIDARATGVDVPNHLGVDPQLRLNLSWRFGRPMEIDAWGIHAELTFGGVPHGCKFPWDAIFLIVSHINGESFLFPDHVPKELLHQAAGEHVDELQAKTRDKPVRARPKLSLVPASDEAAESDVAAGARADADEGKHEAEAPPEPARKVRATQRQKVPAHVAPEPGSADAEAPPAPTDGADPKEAPGRASSTDDAPGEPKKPARSRGHLRLIK